MKSLRCSVSKNLFAMLTLTGCFTTEVIPTDTLEIYQDGYAKGVEDTEAAFGERLAAAEQLVEGQRAVA